MKKNISINIGGIIFHIEEDGFEQLRNYLDSINKYFSTFEDSKEIIEDIESRIAEIFLAKLNEVNQVISLIDVEEVIATMGTTQDFDATIETEPKASEEAEEAEEQPGEESGERARPRDQPKRLYRDNKRKIFGGVAAGIAHYFGIDPLWVRLLFIVLFFNVLFVLGGLSGFSFLAYIILWIVLPADELEEDKTIKKLFRDQEKSVLGGVCSGLASYFGVDRAVLRLIFVLSIFLGGAGIVIYIILWIITPEAKTITEKMQMEGEPVTISNIEENVKKRLDGDDGQESGLAKVLLFPFRLIALIINGIGKMLGPAAVVLVEVIRIFAGLVITITGFCLMLGFILAFLVLVGWAPTWWANYVHLGDFPLELAVSSFAGLAMFSAFLVVIIPSLAVTLAGVMITLKRRVGNAYLGWSLFGIWILGLIGSALFFPATIRDFRTESSIREEQVFEASGDEVITLNVDDTWQYSDYDAVDLRLRGHEDSVYRLQLRFHARGADREEAQENARAVDYIVTQNGNSFTFDTELTFPDQAEFRFQEVDATFYIPNGQVFRMDGELDEILSNTIYMSGYRSYHIADNDWVFSNGRLECLTCPDTGRLNRRNRSGRSARDRSRNNIGLNRSWDRIRGETASFNYDDFKELRVSSNFKLFIEEGDDYAVRLKGDDDDLQDVYINQRGSRLELRHRDFDWDLWDTKPWQRDVAVYIRMPNLESLNLSGACEAEVSGFNNRDMEFKLTGASEVEASVSPDFLEMTLAGASKAQLDGNARRMKASLVGASRIKGYNFKTSFTELRVQGASHAQVYVTEELEAEAGGVSSITYKGRPRVNADENGLSTIRRY